MNSRWWICKVKYDRERGPFLGKPLVIGVHDVIYKTPLRKSQRERSNGLITTLVIGIMFRANIMTTTEDKKEIKRGGEGPKSNLKSTTSYDLLIKTKQVTYQIKCLIQCGLDRSEISI